MFKVGPTKRPPDKPGLVRSITTLRAGKRQGPHAVCHIVPCLPALPHGFNPALLLNNVVGFVLILIRSGSGRRPP